jgi:UDPglucose 6-dehydrogenase
MRGADALVVATEWNQFRNIDLARVKDLIRSSCFFDLRNIYKPGEAAAAGLRYFGIGR